MMKVHNMETKYIMALARLMDVPHGHLWSYNGYSYKKKFWKCIVCGKVITKNNKPKIYESKDKRHRLIKYKRFLDPYSLQVVTVRKDANLEEYFKVT